MFPSFVAVNFDRRVMELLVRHFVLGRKLDMRFFGRRKFYESSSRLLREQKQNAYQRYHYTVRKHLEKMEFFNRIYEKIAANPAACVPPERRTYFNHRTNRVSGRPAT